jgi:transposase-like protein
MASRLSTVAKATGKVRVMDRQGAVRPRDYELLRTGDLAQTFGVHVTTIRRWCKTLGLPFVLLPASKHKRFDPEQIRKWWADAKDQAEGGGQ